MQILKTVQDVRNWRKAQTGKVGFVPTMGALHPGHLSLIDHASQAADHIIVSIFLNPTQFSPNEDLDRYPKPFEADLQHCKDHKVDAVWTPHVNDVYPPDELDLEIDVPALTAILEGAHRPDHFQGVCRVVAKLFGVVLPDIACFGQKDFQQLKVIQSLTAGLSLPIEIITCPTIREPDGLAMSSRNIYLNQEERKNALALSKALREAEHLILTGEINPSNIEHAMAQILSTHNADIDYAVVRNETTLAELDVINLNLNDVVCLIAANIGSTRLIDNKVITHPRD